MVGIKREAELTSVFQRFNAAARSRGLLSTSRIQPAGPDGLFRRFGSIASRFRRHPHHLLQAPPTTRRNDPWKGRAAELKTMLAC